MKIGVYINQPGVIHNGQIWVRYSNEVDFFAAISEDMRTSKITICLPLDTKLRNDVNSTIRYDKSKTLFMRIPYYYGAFDIVRKFYKIFPACIIQALRLARDSDIVGSVMPSVPGCIFCLAAKAYRRRLFILVRGDKTRGGTFFRGFGGYFYRKVICILNKLVTRFFRNDIILPFGEDLADFYKNKGCKNVHVMGAQIPDELFAPPQHGAFPKNPKQINVLYLGRLSKGKNVGPLIEAVDRLAQEYKMFLTIVGSGPEMSQLKKIVARLGLGNNTCFTGRIPYGTQLFEEYRKADVFVLPSFTEGTPRAILEAMALGVPVVASKVGGIPTLVKSKETGILIDPHVKEELVKALKMVITDAKLREKCILNAYNLSKKYSFSSVREKLIAILEE